ncbi:MAG: hypothetical protein GQF41_1017 [Candidatus Rifleibacterium amylolyticum]|nr:MAG: hypothetical protein GQF41_1017 [Candidatus Rifleibacterium amylolyticum]
MLCLKRLSVASLCAFALLIPAWPTFAAIDHPTLFADGEKAFAASNFAVAAENFAAALKYSPADLRTRFRYGQALFSLKRFAESHSQFQSVLQNSPNNIIARIYLAENLVQLKRHDDARSHLEWILKVQPGHTRAREILDSLNGLSPEQPAQALPESMPADSTPLPVKSASAAEKAQEIKLSPYVAVSGEKPRRQPKNTATKASPPTAEAAANMPPAIKVNDFSFEKFLADTHDSFAVNLELVRFNLENGDLNAAAVSLEKAAQLSRNTSDSRRFLELQILSSMFYIYQRDFNSFGKNLVKLKPALGDKSYQSFLNIYNQGAALTDPIDQARLAAGIAMGAGHHAVAARLLLEVFVKKPEDMLTAHLLADAQLQSLDYKNAENTMVHIARNNTDNAEAHFNLARFYLTVFYQPELARRYAAHAASLKPGDARIEIILGLADYAEGKIDAGIARIRKLLPVVDDEGMKQICQQIINDGRQVDAAGRPLDFISVLALPGAPHAPAGSYNIVGEDALRRGSFLTAMKHFAAAHDYAEIGRTYLGLASALASSGENDKAAIAAGYGLASLDAALQQNPANGRANLYVALYHFERNDLTAARQELNRGLAGKCDQHTRKRLTALLSSLGS